MKKSHGNDAIVCSAQGQPCGGVSEFLIAVFKVTLI
jgi:hypothetical protein